MIRLLNARTGWTGSGAVNLAFGLFAAAASLGISLGAAPPPPPPTAPPTQPPASTPATQPATAPAANLPDATEIVNASLDQLGSQEQRQQIKNISVNATATGAGGETIQLDLKMNREGAFHLTQSVPDQPIPPAVVGYNGKVGWIVMPNGTPTVLEGMNLAGVIQQIDVMFPFWQVLDPINQFASMKTVDRVTFNGKEAYKVKLSKKEQETVERFGFYDVDTKAIRGMQLMQGPVTYELQFDDWKKIDDLNFFNKLNVVASMGEMHETVETAYKELAFNKADPSAFEPPAEVKEMLNPPTSQPAGSQPATSQPVPPQPEPAPSPAPPEKPHE